MKIIVLMGGESAERRVSLTSGEAVAGALANQGHEVYKVDLIDPVRIVPTRVSLFDETVGEEPPGLSDLPRFMPRRLGALMETLDRQKPDIVFPMLHGGMGEDGRLQACLEMVGIPFVGSGSLASALAMNKPKAKTLFRAVGVPTPDEILITSDEANPALVEDKIEETFGFPAVIKPDALGSAVGLFILKDASGIEEALKGIKELNYDIMIEPFIAGKELTVTVLGDEALSPIEIRPHGGVYDYLSKYTKGQTDYLCPAPVSEEEIERLQEYGLKAHQALGCRHYSRVDFRMTDDGDLFCLEVNTIPGMTATSLVPKAAAEAGINFEELVDRLAGMR
ncbi:D-alanine--D-alanine ligase [candidate division LCP-89 bacterium B3_LCP]|uniref:D-alanine--D-alanine ligase n=1 Tax=candidate division LCP-89 bacterium B3_LCP TaxID=2012998 RepID=A0A532V121_UNCL8|nr:MAG: D-alanine--D-alanine ligase [candidate division LCP-89 bacterium B3_LCP]